MTNTHGGKREMKKRIRPTDHVKMSYGPLATIYTCPYCPRNKPFFVMVKKGQKGAGRGSGLRNGSKSVKAVWDHVKECHAEKVIPT